MDDEPGPLRPSTLLVRGPDLAAGISMLLSFLAFAFILVPMFGMLRPDPIGR